MEGLNPETLDNRLPRLAGLQTAQAFVGFIFLAPAAGLIKLGQWS